MTSLRAELTAANNLLARIHRDGGHHTEQVGFAQSCADADAAWLRRELELDATRAELARVTAERDNWMWAGMAHLRKGHNDTVLFRTLRRAPVRLWDRARRSAVQRDASGRRRKRGSGEPRM